MQSLLLGLSLVGLSFAADLEKRGGGGNDSAWEFYELVNDDLSRITILVLGCMAAFIYIWKMWFRIAGHLRRLASFSNERQRYFVSPEGTFGKIKNHIIYAPLFRNRHNREFQLSSALNMGTLPSRFHTFIVFGIIVLNVVLCVVTVPYQKEEKTLAGVIRNRTGTMATVNMIPLVLLAGRNNPLIGLLQVPFDTFNLIHRWLARIVVFETIAHVFAWAIPKAQTAGWDIVGMVFGKSTFLLTGLIAGCAFVGLMVHSVSPIRHAFYETFLHLHIAMVVVSIVGLWIHLKGLPAQTYLLVAIIFWGLERTARFAIILYRNCGRKSTAAVVEALPGDAMRITLRMARPWTFKPGQHIYLYIPSIGWWMSHPFSVGWSESEDTITDEKGIPMTRQDVFGVQKTTISLLIRRRTGFTNKLYQRALSAPDSRVTLKAFAEGPYGGIHTMDSYGTVVLFAGGVGITHQVPFVRHLVQGYADGTVAARRVTLVWIIQSPEHLEWIRPWMTSILAMDRRREVLRIMLFITRPRNTKEIQSPSATVQMFPGRPNIDTLIGMEVENQVGAMGVLVCGNGSLSDDVRRVCRQRQDQTHVDFVEESFTW
ncbi:ferric reductase family protein [Aspergillus clavatus NRRL 1]|uniref:ferric-chelate reductase (NADPH) n=1 Tax=Aspergillus clavatus (strain ATCC 1007 / CBS 513.65 / DSM 816 / NCTC 3887 / NRRL 1 / QM 1276 / 107) TaxID=344612 RepID=A1CKI6_ASPCL|nr:ferric-chelate reductase, putative [Aspergillus clavatus NRRL 1]EAW09660.1 ferric-chelate reductase, putative [Aspergillus clavatus NRRL 1]